MRGELHLQSASTGIGGKGMALYAFLPIILHGLSQLGRVAGAEALYTFGDSFVDTGNSAYYRAPPYGMTWPGHGAGRACDGRNQVDYLAELFGLPSPTPFKQMVGNQSKGGVNFGVAGAGVTYAFSYTPLDTQVDQFEALVEEGVFSKKNLLRSVALVSLAVNDYTAYNLYGYLEGVETTMTTVVDGIALNLMRIHRLGVRNIMVANLALMSCAPFITVGTNYSRCSNNETLLNETLHHNMLLEKRVTMLNTDLPGAHIVILNQTKAFQHIVHHASEFGFEDPLIPCCTAKNDSHVLNCGYYDSAGLPLYKVCGDLSKAVMFDGIHPTDAAWKVVIKLYASVSGFTHAGPTLHTWIKKYNV